jgi:hypothetical protein
VNFYCLATRCTKKDAVGRETLVGVLMAKLIRDKDRRPEGY